MLKSRIACEKGLSARKQTFFGLAGFMCPTNFLLFSTPCFLNGRWVPGYPVGHIRVNKDKSINQCFGNYGGIHH